MTRFTSFALLVTLAGTPAVAAACAVLCQSAAFHHATSASTPASAAEHGDHDSARVNASHQHDESEATDQAVQTLTASAAESMDHDCCPTAADRSVQARSPGQRTDVSTALSISAAALARVAPLPAFASLRRPPDLNPSGAYSPRSQAPLVLRI